MSANPIIAIEENDAVELYEVLEFLADFFNGSRRELLVEALEGFCPGYELSELEETLRRLAGVVLTGKRS